MALFIQEAKIVDLPFPLTIPFTLENSAFFVALTTPDNNAALTPDIITLVKIIDCPQDVTAIEVAIDAPTIITETPITTFY